MTEEVNLPQPVDTSHRDPAFAAQAPKEEAKPNAEQEAQHEDAPDNEGEQNESEQSAATENESADEPQKPKVAKGVQKRLDELTKARRDAEQQAEHWRQMAMREHPKPEPQKSAEQVQQPTDEPTLEDHGYDVAAFTKAWSKWDRAQDARAAEQAKAQQDAHARERKYLESAAVFAAEHPDFHQLLSNPHLPITPVMVEALTEAENPAAVAYHLAKNPGEAGKIAEMSPAAVGRAIAKIESQVSTSEPRQPAQKTVTQAPPPPTILSGTKTPSKKLDEMSMAEYAQHRAEERKAKGLRP